MEGIVLTQSPQTRFMSPNFDHLFVFNTTIDSCEIQRIFKVFLLVFFCVIKISRQKGTKFGCQFILVFGEEGEAELG